MTTKLLQQTLDALNDSLDCVQTAHSVFRENYGDYPSHKARIDMLKSGVDKHKAAIKALGVAIAQPEQTTLIITDAQIKVAFPFAQGWNHSADDLHRYRCALKIFAAIAQPEQPAEPLGRVAYYRNGRTEFIPWPDSPYLDNALDCKTVYAIAQPERRTLPSCYSDDAVAFIKKHLALRNYPANSHNAARAGWDAACDLLANIAQPEQPAKSAPIEINFKQAIELLQMFGGEPTLITLIPGGGHSGKGLYAYYTEIPEEGAEYLGEADDEYLGEADDEATPIAQPVPEQGKRQPLTDERISTIARVTQTAEPGRDGYILPFSFAREIEAAHGITTPKDKL